MERHHDDPWRVRIFIDGPYNVEAFSIWQGHVDKHEIRLQLSKFPERLGIRVSPPDDLDFSAVIKPIGQAVEKRVVLVNQKDSAGPRRKPVDHHRLMVMELHCPANRENPYNGENFPFVSPEITLTCLLTRRSRNQNWANRPDGSLTRTSHQGSSRKVQDAVGFCALAR